jgi:hypothetical protein
MKQAIRENRRGKVRVAEYVILDGCPEVALLLSRMEVCEERHDCYTRWVWFGGGERRSQMGHRSRHLSRRLRYSDLFRRERHRRPVCACA